MAAEPAADVVVAVAEASVLVSVVAEPEAFVGIAPVFAADIAERPAFVGIAPVFDISTPVSAVVVVVDSLGHPRFFVFANNQYRASSASSGEVVGWESVHSSTGARANYGHRSTLSTPGPHHSRSAGHGHSNPSPGHDNVSDTNGLPIATTTSHSRRTGPCLYQEPHTHRSCPAPLPPPEVQKTRRGAAIRY